MKYKLWFFVVCWNKFVTHGGWTKCCHIPPNFFICIYEDVFILIQISLQFVPKDPIDNKSLQLMVLNHQQEQS